MDFNETLYWIIFRKYVEKIQVALKSDKNNEYFTLRHLFVCDISLSLLRMKTKIFQTKVVEKIKTYILCSVTIPPPPENRAIREATWKNIVETDSPQMTIRRMRISCWIPKATKTHSEYRILVDFPLQQWLHERPSVLLLDVHCLYYSASCGNHNESRSLFIFLMETHTVLCEVRTEALRIS
jgi:hypothetical protein